MGLLFECGVRFGRPSILDKIMLVQDMTTYINDVYGVNVSSQTKGIKLVRLLRK